MEKFINPITKSLLKVKYAKQILNMKEIRIFFFK